MYVQHTLGSPVVEESLEVLVDRVLVLVNEPSHVVPVGRTKEGGGGGGKISQQNKACIIY